MPHRDPILFDDDRPVVWTVSADTIHVVAYKLWPRPPGAGQWVLHKEGSTGDDDPQDWGRFNAERLTGFAYWLGIASTSPNTSFITSITLTQRGVVLTDGILPETGRTNAHGVARRQDKVTLR